MLFIISWFHFFKFNFNFQVHLLMEIYISLYIWNHFSTDSNDSGFAMQSALLSAVVRVRLRRVSGEIIFYYHRNFLVVLYLVVLVLLLFVVFFFVKLYQFLVYLFFTYYIFYLFIFIFFRRIIYISLFNKQ